MTIANVLSARLSSSADCIVPTRESIFERHSGLTATYRPIPPVTHGAPSDVNSGHLFEQRSYTMQGVIAGGGPHTVQAGAAMLRQGGNAVDAIVAAAFASFIAEIGVVHTGGSGIAQIFDPASQRSVVYDFFSNMPGLGLSAESLTTRLKAIDFERVTIDFGATTQDFYLGRGAVAVPGNVFGLCALVDDFGSLPLRIILQPALDLAQQGLPMAPFQAQTCRLLGPIYTHTPAARTIFTKNGDILDEGDHLYIPGMFETLSQLAEEGDALLRNGSLAQALISDHSENGGLITPRDLQSYRVYHNDPIRVLYRGHEVLLPPPCSAGGVLTGFTLKLLAEFDAGSLRHGSAEQMQLFYEVMAATTRARVHWETDLAQLPVRGDGSLYQPGRIHCPRMRQSVAPFARGNDHPLSPTKGPNNTSHIWRDRRQRHGGQPDNNGRRIGRLHFARNWFYPQQYAWRRRRQSARLASMAARRTPADHDDAHHCAQRRQHTARRWQWWQRPHSQRHHPGHIQPARPPTAPDRCRQPATPACGKRRAAV